MKHDYYNDIYNHIDLNNTYFPESFWCLEHNWVFCDTRSDINQSLNTDNIREYKCKFCNFIYFFFYHEIADIKNFKARYYSVIIPCDEYIIKNILE